MITLDRIIDEELKIKFEEMHNKDPFQYKADDIIKLNEFIKNSKISLIRKLIK